MDTNIPATSPEVSAVNPAMHEKRAPTQNSVPAPNNAQAEAAARAEELNAVEHDVDQLTGRAAGINSSIDRLRQQQGAYGLGLRGDMAERQGSMKLNLTKAQNAIEHQDLERAKRYAKLAETDIEALEKFIGR
jgi:hypothetical protein